MEKDYLFIWQKGRFRKIAFADIMWLEASRSYCYIRLKNATRMLVSVPLLKVGQMLPPVGFLRISRSYIINLKYVDSLTGNALYIDKESFTIGTAYRQAVFGSFLLLGATGKQTLGK